MDVVVRVYAHLPFDRALDPIRFTESVLDGKSEKSDPKGSQTERGSTVSCLVNY